MTTNSTTRDETIDELNRLRERLAKLESAVERLGAHLLVTIQLYAQEVRTRSLVIVDDKGRERIVTTIGDTATTLNIHGPAGGVEQPTVQLCAAHGETEDDEGRPTGFAAVTVLAKGEPGAEMMASDVDGAPAFTFTNGVNVEAEHAVRGEVRVYDTRGRSEHQFTYDGLARRAW